jgi:translation initiation factor IF-2
MAPQARPTPPGRPGPGGPGRPAPAGGPARPAGGAPAPAAPGTGGPRPGHGGPGRRDAWKERERENTQKVMESGGKRGKRGRGRDRHEAETAGNLATLTKHIKLSGSITVKELADKMGVKETEIIKRLFMKGIMATINQTLELETAEMIVTEMEYTFELVNPMEEEAVEIVEVEDTADLVHRPPVVTIMGHVDHGKTSLLDAIRKTNVTAGEAGGITQHIGAYQVKINDQLITFLDTPGHEAFTAMRARGAKATDIAVLVVAADDGVKPQTIEAISHAKEAGVQLLVAINKIDKPGANPDQVKQQLTEYELVAEEWGGQTVMVPVSAKQKIGLDNLLEMILLVSEVLELKANPKKMAKGLIIEAQLDKGMGPVATVLVQNGTLKVGDNFVVGAIAGKVRAMINDHGRRVKEAGPAMPVEVLGMPSVPAAGDVFQVVEDEKTAKNIAAQRAEYDRTQRLNATRHISLTDVYSRIQEGKIKDLKVILKSDVKGSAEALESSLSKITAKDGDVQVRVIHSGTGDISEADVMLAAASDAIVIGFNVKANDAARAKASADGVDIREYNIIYKAIEDMEAAIKGMLEPEYEEVFLGRSEVRAIFKVGKQDVIAGCMVKEGKMQRGAIARVLRGTEELYKGKLDNLKRFKDDVKEVATGYECGISFDGFNNLQEGDVIEAYQMQVKQ